MTDPNQYHPIIHNPQQHPSSTEFAVLSLRVSLLDSQVKSLASGEQTDWRKERLDKIEAELGTISQGLQQLVLEHRATAEQIYQLRERVSNMEGQVKTMQEIFVQIDKRFEVIDKRFEAIDRRFDGIDKRLDGMVTKEEFKSFQWVVYGALSGLYGAFAFVIALLLGQS